MAPVIEALRVQLTQDEFGELVGVSQQAVSDMLNRGVLAPGADAATWIVAYTAHLREQAAGRDSGPLADARAALAREQRDEVAMRNAVKRKEFAPISSIEEVLAKVGRQVADILEGLPRTLKLRWPNASAEQLKLITEEIVKARNLAAGISLASLIAEDPDGEG
jgi:phage terminase Nu1 subunit (DNA packaging protein)